ncbi:MAG: hypothetical protein H0T77_02015 [Pyrinomonadaceae bacterium]|nr:hypothetical protein [Pyrinomonadaceae bacterium]
MDPPFTSRWQAYGFALTLAFFLLLPAGLSRSGLVRRQDVYQRIPEKFGAFSYIGHQIFDDSSDIDILFLGSSVLWLGIDTPYVQYELSRQLGRPANVITFGSNWRGEELNYILLSEVLQRRKVRMLVITMPLSHQSTNLPHPQSFRWLPHGDNQAALLGLPLRLRLALYGEQVLGAPRHLVGIIRSDIQEKTDFNRMLVSLRGAYRVEAGYLGAPFVMQKTKPPELSARSMIYSPETQRFFNFTQQPLSPYQMHFLRLTTELTRNSGVPVAILNIPLSRQRRNAAVEERMHWSEVFGLEMPIIGVPPATLFRGMTDLEINRCFSDEHMNLNGSDLLTRTVTPAILTVYEEHARRSQ